MISARLYYEKYPSPFKLRRRWLRALAESRSMSTLIGLTPLPPCRNSKFIGYMLLAFESAVLLAVSIHNPH